MATETTEHAQGMPQLDFSTFPNQIFWLVVTLIVIYFLMSRIALPRIASVLAERHGAIQNDLDKAEEMKVKAQLLDEKDFLDKAKFMQAVENETPETIVKNIFRPNSAEEINLVKNELLSPEAFAAVQENALGQMISEAVSVGQLRSTARLTDIFKPGVLSSALLAI